MVHVMWCDETNKDQTERQQFFIYGGVTVMADRARRWLQGRPAASMLANRCVGGLLIAAAMLTGFEGWQRI